MHLFSCGFQERHFLQAYTVIDVDYNGERKVIVMKILFNIIILSFCGLLGFHFTHKFLEQPKVDATLLELNVHVMGTRHRPVYGARVALKNRFQTKEIGVTDRKGSLYKEIKVPKGQPLTIQISGKSFTAKQTLLVPRQDSFEANVLFSPEMFQTQLAELHNIPVAQSPVVKNKNRVPVEPAVEVVVTEKYLRSVHRPRYVKRELLQSLKHLSRELQKKKITSVILRPVWKNKPYFEVILKNRIGVTRGSFLFVQKGITSQTFDLILRTALRRHLAGESYATLAVQKTNHIDIRAYVNGFPLKRSARTGAFQIRIPFSQKNFSHFSLSVTGNGVPLYRKVYPRERLREPIFWKIPNITELYSQK